METVITAKIDGLDDLERLTRILTRTIQLPRVLGLIGELGAGKTTFVQSLAKSLDIPAQVVSPTFALEHRYQTNTGIQFIHADLFRIESVNEVTELGLFDVIGSQDTLVVVEWADKFAQLFDQSTVWIEFCHTASARTVIIRGLRPVEVLSFETFVTMETI